MNPLHRVKRSLDKYGGIWLALRFVWMCHCGQQVWHLLQISTGKAGESLLRHEAMQKHTQSVQLHRQRAYQAIHVTSDTVCPNQLIAALGARCVGARQGD